MMCRPELIWYIGNKEKCFDLGLWPDNPYLPVNGLPTAKAPVNHTGVKVPVNVVEDFVLTIENRLTKCGRAGLTLIEEIQSWDGYLSASIPYYKLSTDARDALNYCCGHERAQSFAQWKADRKDKDKKKLKKR